MKVANAAAVSVAIGAAFGAATSLVNRLATPADAGGSPIADSALEPIARVASLLLGPVLGAVGATIRQPGVAGLLASLTVPAGAVLQIILIPPGGSGPLAPAEAIWARGIVLTAAAIAAALLIRRFATPTAAAPRV